jgi:hypothetical protein
MAQPTRFGRIPTKKIPWEERESLAHAAPAKKTAKNDLVVPPKRAASPNAPPLIHELAREPPAAFAPPILLDESPFLVHWIERLPMQLFIRFLGGMQSLIMICEATNVYADRQLAKPTSAKEPRPWSPLSPTEFITWLGGLIYMANHIEPNREAFWNHSFNESVHNLGRWMSKTRWEQIHRFLTFNATPRANHDDWWSPIEPLASRVRSNCQSAVKPSNWVAVDEAMVAFTGRSKHVVNLPSKPIPKGYKIWCLALKKGYIWSWRWHSRVSGPEGTKKGRWFNQMDGMPRVQHAVTFQVPQDLCQELINYEPGQKYVVFLDNLFLTVELAHTLLQIGVGVMGTTRKNRDGFPQRFLDAKQSDAQFTYGSCSTEVVDHCLCFLWQDNAKVLGISTAFAMCEDQKDYIIKRRKRPLNNAVGAAEFGGEPTKNLPIPKAIDYYNCNHNLVDNADHLRSNFTIERHQETRTWRPLAFWLLDTCLVNSYLLWMTHQSQDVIKSKHTHRWFREELFREMFAYKDPTPSPPISPARTRYTSKHYPVRMPLRAHCEYSIAHGGDCIGGSVAVMERRRNVLAPITGNTPRKSRAIRSKRTQFGCSFCQKHLCIRTGCYDKFHANLYRNHSAVGI